VTVDTRGRLLRDLRISVTDRCNFRCAYCMPREQFGPDFAFVERSALLSFEEIERIVRVFARLGVRKLRLTGGEPLLRRDLPRLVSALATVDGIDDLAMTTNGSLLARHASALREAGLNRLTVSLDALDQPTFSAMADTPIPVEQVLAGITTARDVGFDDVRINAVVKRGVNEHAVVDLAGFGRETGCTVRFIEYMDVGTTNGWRLADVVPAAEILTALDARFPIEALEPRYPGEVATRFRYRDGGGEVGVIASVTRPFCATCTRARLSAVGELYTCLFAGDGTDLRAPLRAGADEEALQELIAGVWSARGDRYSELRSAATAGLPRVEMSYIGG
jgi:GTP 3',8-cyclase